MAGLRWSARISSPVNAEPEEPVLHACRLAQLLVDAVAQALEIPAGGVLLPQARGSQLRRGQCVIDAFAGDWINETGRVADEQPPVACRRFLLQIGCRQRRNRPAVPCQRARRRAQPPVDPGCRQLEQLGARGFVGLRADANRQMIRTRKRPEISRRRLREHDVGMPVAYAVDVIATRHRQRAAREGAGQRAAHEAVGAVGADHALGM